MLPADDGFVKTIFDVVVRFREHGQYGSQERAVAALRRRAPGHADEVYPAAFNAYLALLERTIAVVRESPLVRHNRLPVTDDAAAALREVAERLRAEAGGSGVRPGTFVEWVYFWHCLK